MKKKGFTLVELLAVIAILAILVIIALPNVLRMFRNAKQNTFISEVQNLVRSAETKYVTGSMKNENNTCFDSKTNPLDMSGRDNLIYKIRLSDKGQILEVNVKDSEYEIIAVSVSGINREELGKTYKVSEAKTQILDCNGNALSEGEEVKTKYIEKELHGADPVLKSPMIPVMISDTGVVTYAHDYDEWYKYESQKWANAVILVDTPSKEYTEGEVISESDIRAYFVWIPKYSYRIFNLGNYEGFEDSAPTTQIKEVEIEFGTRTTTNDDVKKECASPMESGATGDCDEGDLMTHPAFLSIPSNGFWVGKFETGYNQNIDVLAPITEENISTWTAEKSEVNDVKQDNIIVKPNVHSWKNANIYNFFMSSYKFNRNLDSHMMKNTEWGAVVYLSYSQYGIKDEVRINNNSNFLTGYAASEKDGASSADPLKTLKWNTEIGHLASTTGNITGVYDMNGGTFEYMASYKDESDQAKSGMESIVSNNDYSKYLDKYSKSSNTTLYKYRILGDATGEIGPFLNNNYYQNTLFADDAYFVEPNYPWFGRGGHYSFTNRSGQFLFSRNTGEEYTSRGSRLILNP